MDLVDRAVAEGRRAAVEALAQIMGEDVNRVLLQCLEERDPGVQAAATAHLRSRSIPGSLGILLSKLDSPHEVVRQAARDALDEYRFQKFLSAFEQLDDRASRQAGQLIKKIDPETVPLLQAEFESQRTSHRLRALHVTEVMDLIDEMQGRLTGLLGDEQEDGAVRTEAARLLANSASTEAVVALEKALAVKELRVRSQAELSLDRIRSRSQEFVQ